MFTRLQCVPLERLIDDAYERRAEIGADSGPVRAAVDAALAMLRVERAISDEGLEETCDMFAMSR